MKFFSRDEGFFDYFRTLAQYIGKAAELLGELFDNPGDATRIATQIKAVETDGDLIVHQINQRIDTSFVTPLDREDIHLLATRLDNVIDLINSSARRVVMYRITHSRPGGKLMSELLVRAAREIQTSIGDITKRQNMVEHSRCMKLLEEEGDAIYAQQVAELFEPDLAAIEVIKWTAIYDALEEAVDECEDVSNVLESIALKNS